VQCPVSCKWKEVRTERSHTKNSISATQGHKLHNFGLKSGGTNSDGEQDARGSARRKGRRMGRKHPLLIRLWCLGERLELSKHAPAENGFIVI